MLLETMSYNSLNSLRSTISLIMGSEIGSDPLIKRYLKGVFRSRPTKPKYNYTWNPTVVLRYINSLGKNEQLPIEILGKKLLILLALTTAHRVQTFSNIRISNIAQNGNEIQILITDLIKTSNPNNFQPLLRLPFFRENINLCVASVLSQYIGKTSTLRQNSFLFISHKKPHKKVTSQTLSRWIKDMLANSGINTNLFKAHSTRHASTSAASRAGVSIDEIRKTAGWTENSSVFAKFYNCQIKDKLCFAESILKLNS